MSTTTDTADAFAAAGFVAPDYGGQCLDGVLPAVCAALGVEPAGNHPAAGAARERLGIPTARRICVVLVDGLGQQNLAERAGHAPFLRGLGLARALTTGYPTTTATAIPLFGTGCGPGRTAMVGYTVHNPETGDAANLVSWTGVGPGDQWQREPSLFEPLVAAGIPVTSVGPSKFAGSGLTAAALRGGRFVGAESLDARVDAAVVALREPGLVYLYWGAVDKAGHRYGWRSPQWGEALGELDRELGRLARSVPRDTVVVITADHGMVDVDPAQIVDVASEPELRAGVRLVTGEPRACQVHVDGDPDAVLARWRERLAGSALVVRRDEAIDVGWFGPVAEHVRPVIGDLVVSATGVAGVGDTRFQTVNSLRLPGMHGSFTPWEMLVPLLVVG